MCKALERLQGPRSRSAGLGWDTMLVQGGRGRGQKESAGAELGWCLRQNTARAKTTALLLCLRARFIHLPVAERLSLPVSSLPASVCPEY